MKRFIRSGQEPPAYTITDAIRQAKIDLDCAYTNFNHALEQDLIDCYIYQLKSAQMRYRFLLNCAKQGETAERTVFNMK